MIKLLTDIQPFTKGEVLTFGREKDAELVSKGMAVWVKVSDLNYKIK
jgi:hypothetical protein